MAITTAMHGFRMLRVLRADGGLKKQFDWARTFTKGMLLSILASWVILLVYPLEVFAWAGFSLNERGEHDHRRQRQRRAYVCNFVLMDYTTLESSYNLHLRWRLLEGNDRRGRTADFRLVHRDRADAGSGISGPADDAA